VLNFLKRQILLKNEKMTLKILIIENLVERNPQLSDRVATLPIHILLLLYHLLPRGLHTHSRVFLITRYRLASRYVSSPIWRCIKKINNNNKHIILLSQIATDRFSSILQRIVTVVRR